MATPTCVKCDSTDFEVTYQTVKGATEPFTFVICSACGAIVGTLHYYDPTAVIMNHHRAMEGFAEKMGHPLRHTADDLIPD